VIIMPSDNPLPPRPSNRRTGGTGNEPVRNRADKRSSGSGSGTGRSGSRKSTTNNPSSRGDNHRGFAVTCQNLRPVTHVEVGYPLLCYLNHTKACGTTEDFLPDFAYSAAAAAYAAAAAGVDEDGGGGTSNPLLVPAGEKKQQQQQQPLFPFASHSADRLLKDVYGDWIRQGLAAAASAAAAEEWAKEEEAAGEAPPPEEEPKAEKQKPVNEKSLTKALAEKIKVAFTPKHKDDGDDDDDGDCDDDKHKDGGDGGDDDDEETLTQALADKMKVASTPKNKEDDGDCEDDKHEDDDGDGDGDGATILSVESEVHVKMTDPDMTGKVDVLVKDKEGSPVLMIEAGLLNDDWWKKVDQGLMYVPGLAHFTKPFMFVVLTIDANKDDPDNAFHGGRMGAFLITPRTSGPNRFAKFRMSLLWRDATTDLSLFSEQFGRILRATCLLSKWNNAAPPPPPPSMSYHYLGPSCCRISASKVRCCC
jgi:hypothetical protein